MGGFFTAIYRFFKRHRVVMWLALVVTLVVFAVFGLRVKYEEDISKLMPAQDSATQSGLAFGNLKVKDKIFVQIHGADGDLDPWTLAAYMDEFTDSLTSGEGAQYISGILSRIDDDVMMMALDYALSNVPALVDTSCYAAFDDLLTPAAIDAQMARNVELVENDYEGSISTMVGYDPAALRGAILAAYLPSTAGNQNSADKITGAVTTAETITDTTDTAESADTDATSDTSAGATKADLRGALGGFALVDGQIFCPDSTVALAFISPDFNSLDSKAGAKLVKALEREIKTFTQAHPDAEVLFHGNPVQSVFNARQIKKDLFVTVGISLILICLLICICFRSKSTLLMLLFPIVYGALFALACVDWISGGMSLLVLGLGALILGVALSYCLHVLTHYKYVSDPQQVLRDEATPVILGCLTTIGAFAGLLFTQSSLLKDFGIFASLAMIGTTLFALIFLPQFFNPKGSRRNEKAFNLINKISDYPLDRKPWLLILITLICAVCCYTQKWVTFDSNLRNIGYNEPKVIKSRELYDSKNNNGLFSMYYGVVGETLDEALTDNIRVSAVLDSLKNEGTIQSRSEILSLFATQDERDLRTEAWTNYWTPAKIAEARRNVTAAAKRHGLNTNMFETFYTMVETNYDTQPLYDAGVFPDELLCNYIEPTSDGRYIVFTSVLMDEANKLPVSDAVAACPNAVVIDPFYYTNDMVRVLNDDFNLILNISVIFVFIVLLISFRSPTLAILAFLPMALSWFTVKGVMGIFGIQFNLINIIIATFIFGIGVDYSIFMMRGLLAKASGKDDNLLAYHKTAIFFSAFALIVVVVALLFATHPAISSIGLSTLIGMVSTILITYTLQPFLFRQLMKLKYFRKRFGPKRSPQSDGTSNGTDPE
ncbi:MAG: MMPL family transporter, partial [Bacteroidales bacterium]|nr:MMPL family transporter [Bacteroidales bacterium]